MLPHWSFGYVLSLNLLLLVLAAFVTLGSRIVALCGAKLGDHLRHKSLQRRELILARSKTERKHFEDKQTQSTLDGEWEKIDKSRSSSNSESQAEVNATTHWDGVVGFFHPFCNAGGGGERVLWAAVRATQDKWPHALCAVYTGDHEANKEQILQRVKERFNIRLHPPTITFLYLSTRYYVLSSTWPHFTLLGQSLGSLVLGYDAFSLLDPDVYIDTMGYAFTIALCKWLFPKVPTAAYVHYPTISTDMLDSLDDENATERGVNAGMGKGWRGYAKRKYWHMFAWLYGWVGGSTDVVMTNSNWTIDHVRALWEKGRKRQGRAHPLEVVYPPVAVEELERSVEVTRDSERDRRPEILYIAQFRPEKDHQLVLRSFAKFFQASPTSSGSSTASDIPHLTLIGSVRNAADETHIYALRLLAHELHVTDSVTFLLNAPWNDNEGTRAGSSILSHLRSSTIGVNAMWNEHFGIGVVEYQAAGLISVVHDSGGPKRDIVVDLASKDGGKGPTGYKADDVDGFAEAYGKVLNDMNDDERWQMRLRARESAQRFSEGVFKDQWNKQMQRLVELRINMT